VRRLGKAAAVHDPREQPHGVKSVHGSNCSELTNSIAVFIQIIWQSPRRISFPSARYRARENEGDQNEHRHQQRSHSSPALPRHRRSHRRAARRRWFYRRHQLRGQRGDAEALAGKIEKAGGRAITAQADVSDPAAVARMFDAADAAFGGVMCW
jgi:hypothetical protein